MPPRRGRYGKPCVPQGHLERSNLFLAEILTTKDGCPPWRRGYDRGMASEEKSHAPAWGFTSDERLLIAGVALLVVMGLAAKYIWLRAAPGETPATATSVEDPA